MFNLFKKKSKLEKLKSQHKELLKKAFLASKSDRKLSDKYMLQAFEIEQLMIECKKNNSHH